MIKKLKPYFLLIIMSIVTLVIYFNNNDLGTKVIKTTGLNFYQMFGVLPPIFLLIGFFDVWVPKEKVIKYMGEKSGIIGILLSIFLGAFAAGPLYAAFPIASIMIKKGAKFSNILIFIGAWSTMKIPMFLFEMSALGYKFAISRLILSFISILIMAFIIDRIISADEKEDIYNKHISKLDIS